MRATRDQAQRANERAQQLAKSGGSNLISPEAVEQAQTAVEVATANLNSTQAQLAQARASLQEARDNLAKTHLVSPINGRVTRLAVEEGEVAVPGTFSRETGLLMTIADLSVILAKVQVDETDVVRLAEGDSVQVAIDAFPDTTFLGHVSKISHSAQLATAAQQQSGSNDRAVDFDVEVTLAAPPHDVRPDLSCTARIVTDTRAQTLSIPIIALTVRDHEALPTETKPGDAPPSRKHSDTLKFGPKKEREGVFVVRGGVASFRPVKVGVAGDEYFEVLDGLREGEEIVAGTYQAIRDLKDGTKVRPAAPADGKKEVRVS
jgi:HlyD family secretion protein